MIVVDTSVLVDFFRDRSTPAVECLQAAELDGSSIAIPAVCCQELLQGARDEREWRLLAHHLAPQTILTAADQEATHLAAARIYFDGRRRGLTIRSTVDCWIAQLTLDNDGLLLHDDDDFERISTIRPLRCRRG